jgi:hypothetical protein
MTKTKKKKFSVFLTREMTIVDYDIEKAIDRACKLLNIKKEQFRIIASEIDLEMEKICGRGLYKNDPDVNNPDLFPNKEEWEKTKQVF